MGQETLGIQTRLAANLLTCRFKFDKKVHEGEAKYFRSPEEAKGSTVPEKIFGVDGGSIEAVKIGADQISVTRNSFTDWPAFTKKIAAIVWEAADAGAEFCDPAAPSNIRSAEEIKETVQDVLETQINPAVASHGGEISLIDVKGTTVYVKLGGGCQGCGMASMTLKQGVERALRDALPELDEVLDVTDHASGENPYYAPSKK
jgi:Fe-S cluster biogenesis protein NfuA